MAAADIRTALQRLGFTNDAAQFIVNDQGMDTLEEYRILTDVEVDNLCKVVRRPGGTIPNPTAPADGQPPTLPNPGIAVSLRAENNLKLTCYFLRYRERTSRAVVPADITLANVRALTDHRTWEEARDDVEAPEINARDWPRMIEALEEYLCGCLGVSNIPLAYVIRTAEAVPAVDPAGGYPSRTDELIARAPILTAAGAHTPTYLSDRIRVWELLSALTREHDCWTYVRPAQRTCDGRLAFMGLKDHYLGANNVENMSSRAEKKLLATTYTGEKRRWNFEKFVKVHVDQHAILTGLTEHGYARIDERSKVRHLLTGIKTTALDTVKTRIMSDAALRNDFAACVNLCQDFIEQNQSQNVCESTIATVSTETPLKWDEIQPDMSVEDRYYTKAEYNKLSKAKQKGLQQKRLKRGQKPGKRKSSELNLSKRTIKALATALKTVSTDDDDTTTTEPLTVDDPPTTNRNNKALKRRKT